MCDNFATIAAMHEDFGAPRHSWRVAWLARGARALPSYNEMTFASLSGSATSAYSGARLFAFMTEARQN
jgi:hypothetical protein